MASWVIDEAYYSFWLSQSNSLHFLSCTLTFGKGSPITWQNIDASLPGRRDWIRGVTFTSGIAVNKFAAL
jgi:hypothetical protein